MPAQLASESRFAGSLLPWALLPLLCLAPAFLLAIVVPGSGCEGPASGTKPALILLATLAGTAACVGAGAWRWLQLSRDSGDAASMRGQVLLGLLAIAAVLLLWAAPPLLGLPWSFKETFLLVLLAAFAALVALLGAAAAGRRAADVGALLPLYLVGTGLLVCLPIGLLLRGFSKGVLC